jgi:hypothetical protein
MKPNGRTLKQWAKASTRLFLHKAKALIAWGKEFRYVPDISQGFGCNFP